MASSFDQFENSVASMQEIDIRWNNLNVFVAQPQMKRRPPAKTSPINLTMPLLSDQASKELDELNAQGEQIRFKQILHNQAGYAKHGETLAIMGPSGAGKTTLLAVLTQKFTEGKLKRRIGDCLANGQPYNNTQFTTFGVFVMQNDLLFPCLTVKETLMFSARMRLRGSDYLKERKVDKLIKELQLTHCQDTFIGNQLVKGISGGERKRACIGVELVADPIVLILDEPTSGLDSFTAYTTMNILRELAKNENKCIIFSIHTPSYDIFTLIDRLLLLQNGRMIYQGPSQDIIPYIQKLGQQVPEYQNICDFFMYEITIGKEKTVLNSTNYEKQLRDKVAKEIQVNTSGNQGYQLRNVKNSFCYQFGVLVVRAYINYVRDPQLLRSRIFISCFFSLFYFILYWGVAQDPPANPSPAEDINLVDRYLINVQGALFNLGASCFFSAVAPVISMCNFCELNGVPRERTIFLKEENSKSYDILPYFMAKVLTEMQFVFSQPIICGTFYYFALRFPFEVTQYLKFLIVCICMSFCGNGIGIMAGSMFPDAAKSAALAPLVFTPLQMFGGQYSNFGTMPVYFAWIQYISPFKYVYESFVRTFFEGVTYTIVSPDGQVLQVINPIQQLNFTQTYWSCAGVLIALGLMFHILAVFFLKALIRKLNA